MSNTVHLRAEQVKTLLFSILNKVGARADVAHHLVEGIVQASLRGVDSHGIRLFPHYLRGLEEGRLNKHPEYKFVRTAAGAGKLDGDHAPGHAAAGEGMLKAIELGKEAGVGAVAVHNSSHFGAAAYYALMAAKEDMIGLCFTHATAHLLPHGGLRPFLGNNPICLAAPCEGEDPFCLDMATSVATFNKIEQFRERGEKVPIGWGVDEKGQDTDDPNQIQALLPIGGYKGSGLSMMVEILCSILTGAPYGPNVSQMFGSPMGEKRLLGHYFMAIRVSCFVETSVFKKRLKEMMDSLRKEPSRYPRASLMAPGDPEKKMFVDRAQNGIPVPEILVKQLVELGEKYQVGF